ncbi:MAG: hypothetical protein V4850_32345 [Myxococcota bacterium]
MPPLTPELDDRYESIDVLEVAGATTLYRARHRVLGADHVLRVLHAAVGERDADRARFRERAQAQASVRHPAVVRVHNVFDSPEMLALAVDYISSEDARTRVARDGPLAPVHAAAVVAELADALEVAHAAGVVHHELHPGLVLFPTDGSPARLAHFSARYVTTHDGPAIPFASPEELLRPGDGDARADVFALGALLHFLLTGAPPFPMEAREAALQRRLDGAAPAAWGGDAALAAILRAAMGERVIHRTPTAAGLAAALQRFVERTGGGATRADTLVPAPIGASLGNGEEAGPAAAGGSTPAVASGLSAVPTAAPTVAPVEATAATTVTVPRRPTRATGRGLPLLLLGGLIGFGFLASVAAVVGWQSWQAGESRRVAAEGMAALQHYKTDPAANADPDVVDRAARTAARAVEHADTPEALAANGLARVWDEGWHHANATWDEQKFLATSEVVRAAAATGRAEGVFAHGLLSANACKILPIADVRRPALCAAAERDYAQARTLLEADPRGWLRFELWWSLAAMHGQRALEAVVRDDAAAAHAARVDGLAVCERARSDLFEAPVNDSELGQECVPLAGGAGDIDAYLWWSGWLQDDDRAADGKLSTFNVERIYRGALPACGKLVVSKRNRRRKSLPETDNTGSSQFCYAAGLLALGCDGSAALVVASNTAMYPEQPWFRIGGKVSGRACYLDEM